MADRTGKFVQFSGIDQDLARRFKSLCEFHGKPAGDVLAAFMREYLDRYGPHTAPPAVTPSPAVGRTPRPKGRH